MTQEHYTWDQTFIELFHRCLDKYRGGNDDFTTYYSNSDLAFLSTIGHKPREFFDFVEDFGDGGDPSIESSVLIASVRRDYFLTIQNGQKSETEMQTNELPGRDSELGGHTWLPRILQKARNKLKGENCPDIMYSCGGDRQFLKQHDIHPADFLRVVWAADDDDQKVVDYVNSRH